MTKNKPEKEYSQAQKEAGIREVEQYFQRKDEEIKKTLKAERKIKREKGIITSLAYIGGMGIIFVVIYLLFHLRVPHFILLLLLFIMIVLLFGGVSILISRHIYGDDRF